MQNEEGTVVDLYVPRKWYIFSVFVTNFTPFSLIVDLIIKKKLLFLKLKEVFFLLFWLFSSATNRLITAKDHASVQINIGHVDENGIYTGQFTTFALSGFIRAQVSYYTISCFVFNFPSIF